MHRLLSTFSVDEVAQHNSADDCWITAHGIVYDATRFMAQHPGGTRSILQRAGQDATEDFDFHLRPGKKLWKSLAIGNLEKKCGEGILTQIVRVLRNGSRKS